MIGGVLRPEPLERIPGQHVPAMIIDRLHHRKRDEPHGLPDGQAGEIQRGRGADGVEDERLEKVGIKCSECVGDVDPVVDRVEVYCEVAVSATFGGKGGRF